MSNNISTLTIKNPYVQTPIYINNLNDHEFILLGDEEGFIHSLINKSVDIPNDDCWKPLTEWFSKEKVDDGNTFRMYMIKSTYRRNQKTPFVFEHYLKNNTRLVFMGRMTEEGIQKQKEYNKLKLTKGYLTKQLSESKEVYCEVLDVYTDDYLRDYENDYGRKPSTLMNENEIKDLINDLYFLTIIQSESSKLNKNAYLFSNYKTLKIKWK